MAARPLQPDGRVHGVIAAVRREDDRWLLIRRSDRVIAPLKVCFPGGAIEVDEPQRDALRREMVEELGVAVTPLRCCWRWDSPQSPLTLWGWLARLKSQDLRPNAQEVAEILWLTADEAVNHPHAMPTNRDFVRTLLEDQVHPIDLVP